MMPLLTHSVSLRPAHAWSYLSSQPPPTPIRSWDRPLIFLFVLGCSVALITSAKLDPLLLASSVLYWSFVPAAEICGLLLACRRMMPPTRAIDLFFAGHGPWMLWLIGLTAIWSLASTAAASELTNHLWRSYAGIVVVLWSLWIDYWFFRIVCQFQWGAALRALAIQRLVSWAIVLTIFGAPAAFQEITERLWK